jgi:hypothetical protein
MPIFVRSRSMSTSGSVSSTPLTTILPPFGSSSRFTQRSSVDLPEPDGPMMQTTSPRSTLRSMFLRTSSGPNDFFNPVISTNVSLMRTPSSCRRYRDAPGSATGSRAAA